MERDIYLKFEEIYPNKKNSDDSDKEYKMDKILLDNKDQFNDSNSCNNLFQYFSCCFFFLCV